MAHSFLLCIAANLTLIPPQSQRHRKIFKFFTMRIIRKSLFSFISLLLISSLCSCGGGRSRHAAADTSDEQGEEQTESAKVKGSYSAAHPLELKLYMERSGSMVSFDTNQSSGDFKGP